jgi:hypothetical protein
MNLMAADLGGARRDPLSVLYDGDAAEILDRLYGAPMTGGVARTIAYIASPMFAQSDNYDGSRTVQERAFQRAVYYQLKRRRPARSARFDWASDTIPGLGRPVTISLFTSSAGRRYAEGRPESELWTFNEDLRSAGRP